MDPDQTNAPGALDWSRSIRIQIKRPGIEESGSGLGQPDPSTRIKGVLTRFHSFLKNLFSFFFSSLRRSLLFVWTLTLIRFKPTQKHVNHVLNRSCYGSKRESYTRTRSQPFEWCESEIFISKCSNRSFSLFFRLKLLWMHERLLRFTLVVNFEVFLWLSKWFFVLGFVFWFGRFEMASDSHHSGFLWCWRKRWNGIRVLPGFLEIQS